MNRKFHSSIEQKENIDFLKLSGVIDEDNELLDLPDQISADTVVIHLADVERINSCGVRDWVNWISKLEDEGVGVVLVECSPAIVAQMNLANSFAGTGLVKSFYAPYFCPSCDVEKVLLVGMEEMKAMETPKAPTCRCDECDGLMVFDDMEDSYFAFVANVGGMTEDSEESKLNAAVNRLLSDESNSGGRKIKSRGESGVFVGGGSSKGLKSGSSPGNDSSGGSLPSMPLVPSLPSVTSLSGGAIVGDGESGGQNDSRAGSRSNVALILVMCLLFMTVGVLLYVIFSGRGG